MICGIIPARGGSKAVARKNVRPLNGRPLIEYTIEAALAARSLDRVLVSTEDDEIAELARRAGAEVPFRRPPELAAADVGTLPVLQHAAHWIEESSGASIAAVVTLQPTSPLRRACHIDEAVGKWRQSKAESVVTVCPVEHSPYWMGTVDGDRFQALFGDISTYRRRQDLPPVFRLNGAVYVTSRQTLLGAHRILGDDTRVVLMNPEESLDIDTLQDFQFGEIVLQSLVRS